VRFGREKERKNFFGRVCVVGCFACFVWLDLSGPLSGDVTLFVVVLRQGLAKGNPPLVSNPLSGRDTFLTLTTID